MNVKTYFNFNVDEREFVFELLPSVCFYRLYDNWQLSLAWLLWDITIWWEKGGDNDNR